LNACFELPIGLELDLYLVLLPLFFRGESNQPDVSLKIHTDMKNTTNLFDYLTDASSYIKNLQARAHELECSEPSDEFFSGDVWDNFVTQIVEDGLKVGQPDYMLSCYYEEECA
jgi:hypothetical protein